MDQVSLLRKEAYDLRQKLARAGKTIESLRVRVKKWASEGDDVSLARSVRTYYKESAPNVGAAAGAGDGVIAYPSSFDVVSIIIEGSSAGDVAALQQLCDERLNAISSMTAHSSRGNCGRDLSEFVRNCVAGAQNLHRRGLPPVLDALSRAAAMFPDNLACWPVVMQFVMAVSGLVALQRVTAAKAVWSSAYMADWFRDYVIVLYIKSRKSLYMWLGGIGCEGLCIEGGKDAPLPMSSVLGGLPLPDERTVRRWKASDYPAQMKTGLQQKNIDSWARRFSEAFTAGETGVVVLSQDEKYLAVGHGAKVDGSGECDLGGLAPEDGVDMKDRLAQHAARCERLTPPTEPTCSSAGKWGWEAVREIASLVQEVAGKKTTNETKLNGLLQAVLTNCRTLPGCQDLQSIEQAKMLSDCTSTINKGRAAREVLEHTIKAAQDLQATAHALVRSIVEACKLFDAAEYQVGASILVRIAAQPPEAAAGLARPATPLPHAEKLGQMVNELVLFAERFYKAVPRRTAVTAMPIQVSETSGNGNIGCAIAAIVYLDGAQSVRTMQRVNIAVRVALVAALAKLDILVPRDLDVFILVGDGKESSIMTNSATGAPQTKRALIKIEVAKAGSLSLQDCERVTREGMLEHLDVAVPPGSMRLTCTPPEGHVAVLTLEETAVIAKLEDIIPLASAPDPNPDRTNVAVEAKRFILLNAAARDLRPASFNINLATEKVLVLNLPGIGDVKAKGILALKEERCKPRGPGVFRSVADLAAAVTAKGAHVFGAGGQADLALLVEQGRLRFEGPAADPGNGVRPVTLGEKRVMAAGYTSIHEIARLKALPNAMEVVKMVANGGEPPAEIGADLSGNNYYDFVYQPNTNTCTLDAGCTRHQNKNAEHSLCSIERKTDTQTDLQKSVQRALMHLARSSAGRDHISVAELEHPDLMDTTVMMKMFSQKTVNILTQLERDTEEGTILRADLSNAVRVLTMFTRWEEAQDMRWLTPNERARRALDHVLKLTEGVDYRYTDANIGPTTKETHECMLTTAMAHVLITKHLATKQNQYARRTFNPRCTNDDRSECLFSQLQPGATTKKEFERQIGNMAIINEIQYKASTKFPMRLPASKIVQGHPYEIEPFNAPETDNEDANDAPTEDEGGGRRPAPTAPAGTKGSKKVRKRQAHGVLLMKRTPMGHASVYENESVMRGHRDSFRRGTAAAVDESKLPRKHASDMSEWRRTRILSCIHTHSETASINKVLIKRNETKLHGLDLGPKGHGQHAGTHRQVRTREAAAQRGLRTQPERA